MLSNALDYKIGLCDPNFFEFSQAYKIVYDIVH